MLMLFTVNAGQNTIVRQSTQSSVTIPFEQTFRDLSQQGNDPRQNDLTTFNYCGCGWPQHMLIPKGTEPGMQFDLFVMLSNYDLDSVSSSVILSFTYLYLLFVMYHAKPSR